MKLPSTKVSVETLQAKVDSTNMLDKILAQNEELGQIYNAIQPLLYEISVAVYGDSEETVQLNDLITKGVEWIKQHSQNSAES